MIKSKKSGARSAVSPVFVSIATNKGKVRFSNEDNFYADILGIRGAKELCGHRVLNYSDRYVFGVCDGMGGEQFGDLASEIAAAAMREYSDKIKKASLLELYDTVNEYAAEANNRICRMVQERGANLSGSTFAMACIRGNMVYPFSIGDSRIYCISGSKIRQVSEDQTLAVKKLKAGIYTKEEAQLSEDAHRLTSFLGADRGRIGLKAFACEQLDLTASDVLLCSDGLTDMCTDEEILWVLMKYGDQFAAQHLVELALARGGIDNITCIVIRSVKS